MQPLAINKRVRLLDCRDQDSLSFFPLLWGAPVGDRGGVIFRLDPEWVFIALDHELNEAPDKLEKDCARRFGVGERQILVLERSKFGSSIVADISAAKDARGSEFVRCSDCKCPKLRNNCVLACNRGHMCCREHILSWDSSDERHRGLICDIADRMRSVQPGLLFVEARAVLAFQQLVQCHIPEHRDNILEAFANSEYWACPMCVKEENVDNRHFFNFNQIDQEIRVSDRLLREAHPQEREILMDVRECIQQCNPGQNLQDIPVSPQDSKINKIHEDVCQDFIAGIKEEYHADAVQFLYESGSRDLIDELARALDSIHSLHSRALQNLRLKWQMRHNSQAKFSAGNQKSPSKVDETQPEDHIVDIKPGQQAAGNVNSTEITRSEFVAQPKSPNMQRLKSQFDGRGASLKELKDVTETEESGFPQGVATASGGAKETDVDTFQWGNQGLKEAERQLSAVLKTAEEKQRTEECERQQRLETAIPTKAAMESQRAEEYERQQRMQAAKVAQEEKEQHQAEEYERQQRMEAARIGQAALEKQRAEEYERQQKNRAAQEAEEKHRAEEYERQQRLEAARTAKVALEKHRAEEYERQQRMEAARVAQEAEDKQRAEAIERDKIADLQRQQSQIFGKIQNFKIRCRDTTCASDELLQSVVDSVNVDEWNDLRFEDFENRVFERISSTTQVQHRPDISSGRQEGVFNHVPVVAPKNTGPKVSRRRNELGTTCDVHVRIPEFKRRAVCTLYEGTGYEALFQELTTTADIDRKDFDQIVLFLVDNAGWCSEITRDEVAAEILEVCVGDIRAHSIIELRKHRIAAVSGKFVMMTIAASERFNQSLQVKVRKMAETYSGYRKIRGDGNCYYRSVIYGLIEQLLISGKRQGFRALIDIFTKLFCPSGELGDAKVAVILRFEKAYNGDIWKTPEEFEEDVLDEGGKLDINLIHLCKRMVSAFLNENKAKEYNGLSLNDAILPSFDVRNMTQFCKEYVMTLGVCAEGAHVDLGVLPSLLRCRSHIVILARERTSDLTILDTELSTFGFDDQEPLADVHLLFRPGHYDLLYTHQQMSQATPDNRPEIVDDHRPSQPIEPKNTDVSAGKNSGEYFGSEGNALDVAPSGPLPKMEKKAVSSSVRPEETNIGNEVPQSRPGDHHIRAAAELMATVPVRGNSGESKTTAADAVRQIQETLSVSEATALKLLNRCSTVEAALDYYFQNMNLFTDESSSGAPYAASSSSAVTASSSGSVVGGSSSSSSSAAATAIAASSAESFVRSADDMALVRQYQAKYHLLHSNIDMAWTVREMGFDMRTVLESIVRMNFRPNINMLVHVCEQANNQSSADAKLVGSQRSSSDTQIYEEFRRRHKRFQKPEAENFVFQFRDRTGFELGVILESIVAVGFEETVLAGDCKARAAMRLEQRKAVQSSVPPSQYPISAPSTQNPNSALPTQNPNSASSMQFPNSASSMQIPNSASSTQNLNAAPSTQSTQLTREDQTLLLRTIRNYPLLFDDNVRAEVLKVKEMGFDLKDAIDCVIQYDAKRAESILAQLQRNQDKGKRERVEGNGNAASVVVIPTENQVPTNGDDLANFFTGNDNLEFIGAKADYPNAFDMGTVSAMVETRSRGYLMSDIIKSVVHYNKKDAESISRHIDEEKRNSNGSGAVFRTNEDQAEFSSAGQFDIYTRQVIMEVYAMGYPMGKILGLVHRGIRNKAEIIRILLDGGISSNQSNASVSPEVWNSSAPGFRSNEDQAAFYTAQLDSPTRQTVLQVYRLGYPMPEILRLVAAGARSAELIIKRLSPVNSTALYSNSSTARPSRNRADEKLYEDFKVESMYFRNSDVGDSVIWSVYDMGFPMGMVLQAARLHIFDKPRIIEHCERAAALARQPQDYQPPRQQSGPTEAVRSAFTGDDAVLFYQARVQYPQVIDQWQEEEMRKARERGCSMEEIIESVKLGRLSAENIVNIVNHRRSTKASAAADATLDGFRPADYDTYRRRKGMFPERFNAVTDAVIREAYSLSCKMEDILDAVCYFNARTIDDVLVRCTEKSDNREHLADMNNRVSIHGHMYAPAPAAASPPASSMSILNPSFPNNSSQMTRSSAVSNYSAATDILSSAEPASVLRSRLVRLGFSSHDVKSAVVVGQCRNLRSAFRWFYDQRNHRVAEHIQDRLCVRDDDPFVADLYHTSVQQLQLPQLQTMEAIVFEDCRDIEDVIDCVEASNLRSQGGAQTPMDDRVDKTAKLLEKIKSMTKPQMMDLCVKLNITDNVRFGLGPKKLREYLENFVKLNGHLIVFK